MKAIIVMVALLTIKIATQAQNWASIGTFNRPPSIVWYDSTDQKLLVAGGFTWFDSTEIHGFGYVQGDSVIGMGCGFEVPCGLTLPYNSTTSRVTGFARYLGVLYVTGYFERAGGQIVNGIAKWQGNDWVPVGSGLSHQGNAGNGIGNGLEVINDELYIYGNFDSINGIEAHGIAKFDGKFWMPVFDLPRFQPNSSSPNSIIDAEWYQGELYVGGNFSKTGAIPPINDLVKWNGSDWIAVGNGITGSFNSVQKLLQYDNKLVIAGGFTYGRNPGSIPGNNITTWDGIQWDTLRGGVLYSNLTGVVSDIKIHHNKLFVGGGFNQAGDLAVNNLAIWDGQIWCATVEPNEFNLSSFEIMNGELYVALGSGSVGDQDSITRFAKWVGSTFGDSCQLVGVHDANTSFSTISLYPNPTNSAFTLTLPPNTTTCTLKIHDITGRAVAPARAYRAGDPPVDVAHLSAGLYFVEVRVKDWVEVVKLVKE